MTANAVLYGSIWIALALFAAGEIGRRPAPGHRRAAAWAWPASATGLAIAVTHVLIALHSFDDWNHALAKEAAARQTEAIYGVAWGGAVFVNYVFLSAWAADLACWRRDALRGAIVGTPGAGRLVLRTFYVVMVANGAVIFAAPNRRWMGLALLAALAVAWRRGKG